MFMIKLRMKKLDKAGFSVVESVIIIVVLAAISVAGYVVYKNHHKAQIKPPLATKLTTRNKPPTPVTNSDPYAGWKTYSNQAAGLTFRYPSNWTSNVTTMQPYSDGSFAGVSGTLTSPSGNPLYWIYQVIGGKGDAGCTPAAGDTPFAATDKCASKQTYSVEQIASAKTPTKNVGRNLFEDRLYITETKYAWPGSGGINSDPVTNRKAAQPLYQICLDPYYNPQVINGQNFYPQPQVGTVMGFELPCNWWDTGFNVTFPVANQAGFNSADAKTAILIMKSFNSL